MNSDARAFLDKATQSLAGAERELQALAFDNVANRSYYAAFQAALALLIEAHTVSSAKIGDMSHERVRSMFAGFVRRSKTMNGVDRAWLDELAAARTAADYFVTPTGEKRARRVKAKARQLVEAVRVYLEEDS
jgi:uncharacterized protein (UPF0332 family)